MANLHLYTVGGTVQAGGGTYLTRKADEELLKLCLEGTFAYILTSRQVGKSSLMVNTARELDKAGIGFVIIDLTELGVEVTAEKWYAGLLTKIEECIMLETDVTDWWQSHTHLGVTQRLIRFFQEVLLAEIDVPIVIFVDEIDSTLRLGFTDDFFAAIRYLYNARAVVPAFGRLSFVLIGVATPSDLISDPQRTPFNIGQRIDLTDFTFDEAEALADGLGPPPQQAKQVLRWVLEWTHGHPYLTLRLCRAIAEQDRHEWSKTDIDQLVADTFFGEESEKDSNLQFVRNMLITWAPDPIDVLTTYRQIQRGRQPVYDEERSLAKSHLKLSGVVRRERNTLCVRNRIYKQVFDLRWVREHWPTNWLKRIPPQVRRLGEALCALLIILIILVGVLLRQIDIAEKNIVIAERSKIKAEINEVAAERNKIEAERNKIEAERLGHISIAQALAARVVKREETDDVGALLARQAFIFHKQGEGSVADQIDEALRKALTASRFTRTIYLHEKPVHAVAFSPDSRLLASGSDDDTVRLWNLSLHTAEPLVLKKHKGEVRAVAFSPDNKLLASGGKDDTVYVWDLNQLTEPLQTLRHEAEVRTVAFSPLKNRLLLASGDNKGHVSLWDLSQPNPEPLRLTPEHQEAAVWAVAFSQDGRLLASGRGDCTVQLWELENQTYREKMKLSVPPMAVEATCHKENKENWTQVLALAFGSHDHQLLAGSSDHAVRLWHLTSSDAVSPLTLPMVNHDGAVLTVALSPDGRRLASGSNDYTVRLTALNPNFSPSASEILHEHKGQGLAVAFSPDGRWLVSGSSDGAVRLSELSPSGFDRIVLRDSEFIGESFNQFKNNATETQKKVAFSQYGTTLAAVGGGDTIRLWDMRNPEKEPHVLRDLAHQEEIITVAFYSDNKTIATGSRNGDVRLWHWRKSHDTSHAIGRHQSAVFTLAFSPKGQILASGSSDRTVKLWDLSNPERPQDPLHTLPHEAEVLAVAFSPDGNTLASCSRSKNKPILLWSLKSKLEEPRPTNLWNLESKLEEPLAQRRGCGLAVAFSQDGKWLASGSDDNKVLLWSLQDLTGAPRELPGHEGGEVWSVAFSPDSTTLASGSRDRTVRLWNLRQLEQSPQRVLPRAVLHGDSSIISLAFSLYDNRLAAGLSNGAVILWHTTERLADMVCERVWRNLTQKEWEQFVGADRPYEPTCEKPGILYMPMPG